TCPFSGNTAAVRGGARDNADSSNPTVTNCTFSGNTAGDSGGGMVNSSSSPTVTNCTFSDNTAGSFGGGMFNINSNPTVTDCTFEGNTGDIDGGGMYNLNTNVTRTNCDFTANTASVGGGLGNAGATQVSVSNCTFRSNTAASQGGAISNFCGGPVFNSLRATNCTFVSNTAGKISAALHNAGLCAEMTVTNCILWDNFPNESVGTTTVNYSDVQGGWPGTGNIDADPLFVDEANGDLRLMTGSPCADAGNNWGVPIDTNDYDQDGNTAELFPVDLDGNPRFNADEADFDPGCGVPVVVDMGAYEYQFAPVEDVIFADLNADGVVGILDLLGVLAAWGDAKNNCLADLDIDGDVGILDLLTLLSNWG
ncbi:MAG: hypothetical protein O6933_02245, partial [Planctomycetota bacterium]|nr:hypothetical protein [Planctomycetota bacterium]